LRRFCAAALRCRVFTGLLPARERRLIAFPQGLGLRLLSKGITAENCDWRNGLQ
jgi:hypothetical protein